jgi:transmembrane sensor
VENFDQQSFRFFKDDNFIKWISHPDNETTAYWEKWLKENPQQSNLLFQARQMAFDLVQAGKPIDVEGLSWNIWQGIQSRTEGIQNIFPIRPVKKNMGWYRVAAVAGGLLITAVAIYYISKGRKQDIIFDNGSIVSSILVKDHLKRVNSTSQNQVVYLVDGSKVTLQPGSSIRHSAFLKKDKREIDLEGNAFFEVAKDPQRPFYVYTNSIILRVLGTSFNVTTDKDNGNITVVVRTGKVSVYKNSALQKAEFILTPNQKIVYSAQNQQITKSELDSVQSRSNQKPSAHALNFNFEEMPVTWIFKELENAYGIPIHYDETVFSRCLVTTSMSDEDFEEKLQIICEAVGANYRIDNNQIFIEGKPCRQ